VVAYSAVIWWNTLHPNALTERFNLISIGWDGAPLGTVIWRFIGNYLTYLGPDFLFLSGDHNPRHNTEFGGMLLWVMLPLLLLGLVAAWRRRRDHFVRFVVFGAALGPVSAALTEESVPHALRAAATLPFLLVLAVEGMILVRDHLPRARRLLYAVAALAVATQGALFTIDMYATWPARSAIWFDSGEIDAITRASALAAGGTLLFSRNLDQPYIQAAFSFRPAPPQSFVTDSASPLLAEMGMTLIDPTNPPAQPGAIAVLSAVDPVPPRAQRLFDEVTPEAGFAFGQAPPRYLTVVVYRLG
jgi:hypothetical protein